MRSLPAILAITLACAAAFGQGGNGRLEGLVTDPQGAVIPGAKVIATQVDTGRTFETQSSDRGEWAIVSLPVAVYRVNVSLQGFKTASVNNVKVDAGVPATVNVVMEIGSLTESIEVSTGAEILQTTSSTVTSTIVGRQINQLPVVTRNALELITTQPGAMTPGTMRTTTINGLPKGSMNITMDGLNIQDQLLKSDDGFFANVMPKPDAIEEVSISTAGVTADLAGQGAAQVRFVTRSGTNEFRGGVFWQHRNDFFNANYYFNNVDGLGRDKMRLNQYGGRLGGPIKKDKFFFFVNHEEFRLPQSYNSALQVWPTAEAARGIFTYQDANRAVRQINLLDLARRGNTTLPSSVRPFPTTLDPIVSQVLGQGQQYTSAEGTIRSRVGTNNDYNRFNYNFQTPGNNERSFPTVKLDYNVTQKHHADLVINYQNYLAIPDGVNGIIPILPGTGTVLGTEPNAGTRRISWSGVTSFRSAWTPSFTTEFRYGHRAGNSLFREEIIPELFTQWRGYAMSFNNYWTSPQNGSSQSRRNTPVHDFQSNITWNKKSHLMTFGGNWTQVGLFQQNVGTQVFPSVTFAIQPNDPVNTGNTAIFTPANFPGSTPAQRSDAAALYASLTGRVAQFGRSVALDEETGTYEYIGSIDRNLQREFALFFQDSWRVRRGLTLNMGLRWNVQFPFQNQSAIYTTTGTDGAWGTSGPRNLFMPGINQGRVPEYRPVEAGEGAYRTYWKQFSPSFGFAYVLPDQGFWRWLSGGPNKSVFRAGYSIATVTEGQNVFTNIFGSNQGRSFTLTLNPNTFPEVFGAPGSVHFRDPNLPARTFDKNPSFPLAVLPGNSINEFDPDLRPGYVQSWTVSFQREITPDTVVDIRWVGNHGTGLWRQVNINEVNIFENGFLTEFQVAQNNLRIAQQQNPNSINFGNQGLPGQGPIPTIQTALGTSSDATLAVNVQRGEAGALANAIAFNSARMNRLTAAGYPANYFAVNPSVLNGGAFLITNLGHSTYNSLQAEVRRRLSKGLLVQGSYVFAKAISNMLASSATVFNQPTTFRDTSLDKGPSPWDIRHGVKFNWIYELPFGPGRAYLSGYQNGFVRKALEGWELSGVTRLQSGSPLYLRSQRQTFNSAQGQSNSADAGVVLHNITRTQLQDMVKIRRDPSGIVYWLPQEIIDNSLAAFESGGKTLADLDPSKPFIGPPTEAGKLGYRVFLYGPWQNYWDFSVLKRTTITERVNVELRANFLNAINTPNFLLGGAGNEVNSSTLTSGFGQTRSAFRDLTVSGANTPGGRLIEFQVRLNF